MQNTNVPLSIVAKVYGKSPSWVRAGIIAGWLPIGIAVRNGEKIKNIKDISGKKGRINYYVSPKLLYEHTGFKYEK